MIQIRQVLCPIDFSDTSRRALDHAAALARWYEARLTVLSVYLNLPAMGLPPPAMGNEERARLMEELRQATVGLPSDLDVELRIEEAIDVHREILEQAKQLPADLLVIGSHGRSGFERLLLGSVTEKVIRKAPCPVMVVPPQAGEVSPDGPVQLRRILCPVDFSDGAARALRLALSLAEEADARLTLLHIIELPPELAENALAEWIDVRGLHGDARADRLARLRDMVPPEAREFCTVETVVREGAAYREILKAAAEGPADLIVMGVQGRGAVDLAFFGSNAAQVTRAAACPVLVVGTT
jgi:nucleotide-binding universal stress UspA family protein